MRLINTLRVDDKQSGITIKPDEKDLVTVSRATRADDTGLWRH